MEQITFQDLPISQEVLQALEKKGYAYPTQVQAEAIGPLMEWKDVIAKAPTGTGKTFAFGIPMISHIDPDSEALQGLILAPTRELALQIGDELRGLLEFKKGIRVAVLYGGQRMDAQTRHPHAHAGHGEAPVLHLQRHFKQPLSLRRPPCLFRQDGNLRGRKPGNSRRYLLPLRKGAGAGKNALYAGRTASAGLLRRLPRHFL